MGALISPHSCTCEYQLSITINPGIVKIFMCRPPSAGTPIDPSKILLVLHRKTRHDCVMTRENLIRSLKIGCLLGIFASPVLAQTDNFDDNNDDGWTRFNPLMAATYTLTGGTYQISSPASPDPVNFGPARAASLRLDVNYTNFCVMADLVAYDNSLPQAMGVMARIQGTPTPGTTAGYVFTYQPADNDVQISRVTNEQPTAVGSAVVLSGVPAPGTVLRLVFLGYGDYFEGLIYDTSDLLNPLAVCSGRDSTYGTGSCGLLVSHFSTTSNDGIDATFDNYSASNGSPPQLTITRNTTTGVTISWPDSALCWILQESPTANPDTWLDVFDGITHDANTGTFSVTETFQAGGPRHFWRWWLPE